MIFLSLGIEFHVKDDFKKGQFVWSGVYSYHECTCTMLSGKLYVISVWSNTTSLTSFPHRSPASDVALCILQEVVHWWGETNRLDGVGHGCWDWQLQQSHIMVHAGAIESRVNDDPLDWDDQCSYPWAQNRSQTHSPVSGVGVTVGVDYNWVRIILDLVEELFLI